MTERFAGTDRYIATDDLMMAVNAAVTLGRPLLIKGEPGTGKTQLAEEIARSLGRPMFEWHVKSTSKAQQGLYEYDAVSRLRDSQLGDARVHDIANYILKGSLWEAFESVTQPVLLIDEIDKADIEFPNDLLRELDRMEFYVYETRQLVKARHRPIIVITSNNEKELPDAFLRRWLLPLHPLSGHSNDAQDRRSPLSGAEKRAAGRGARSVLPGSGNPGIEEEAIDIRAARLDQTAGGRRHRSRGAALAGSKEDAAHTARCVAEERAGRASVRAAGVSQQARALGIGAAVLVGFFFELRKGGVPVSITEFLTLLEALRAGVAWASAEEFYFLARTTLVKDERHYDRFDRVFAEIFNGAQKLFEEIAANVPDEWLRALAASTLTEEEKKKVEALGGWEKTARDFARAAAGTERAARGR